MSLLNRLGSVTEKTNPLDFCRYLQRVTCFIDGSMTLEEQVCSIELAKKLRELGVKQASFFYWKTRRPSLSKPHLVARNSPFVVSQGIIEASAFTVAELGEMLPKECRSHKSLESAPASDKIWVVEDNARRLFYAATKADVRAKMLIHLIENKLIPVP